MIGRRGEAGALLSRRPSAWHPERAALALVLAGAFLSGCGNWVSSDDLDGTYLGPIALSVTESGDPLILLLVCSEPLTEVRIRYGGDGPRTKEGYNGKVGTWEARSPLALGFHELNLMDPGPEWVAHSPESLSSPWSYIVNGYSDTPKAETATVFARAELIAKLTSDTVLVGSELAESRADFEKRECSDPRPTIDPDR